MTLSGGDRNPVHAVPLVAVGVPVDGAVQRLRSAAGVGGARPDLETARAEDRAITPAVPPERAAGLLQCRTVPGPAAGAGDLDALDLRRAVVEGDAADDHRPVGRQHG